MFAFDRDTAVEASGDGRYRGAIVDGWSAGVAPNGGYLLAIGLAALRAELPERPDALTATAHFLAPCDTGPVDIDVEALCEHRRHATGVARLCQDGRERVHVTATLGHLGTGDGMSVVTAAPPPIPDLEECIPLPPGVPGLPALTQRFDLRLHPATAAWVTDGVPTGRAEIGGWVRFSDHREPDPASLVVAVDCFPPAVRNLVEVAWVPTLELTVHVRGRPSPGWLRAWYRSRVVTDGYLEEEAEIWDASDRLVAMGRQLALVKLVDR